MKTGELDLIKQILDKLSKEQKEEILTYLGEKEYKSILEEAKNERTKLINASKQQATYIANLEKKEESLLDKIAALESALM
jgi:Mg/Co/Ni transporter MgtE